VTSLDAAHIVDDRPLKRRQAKDKLSSVIRSTACRRSDSGRSRLCIEDEHFVDRQYQPSYFAL